MPLAVIDHAQVTVLFREHREDIMHYLLQRVRCPDTTQDLSQETYLRLLRQQALPHADNPTGYLYKTAERLAIDFLRSDRRINSRSEELNDSLECPAGSAGGLDHLAATMRDAAGRHCRAAQPMPARVFIAENRRTELCGYCPATGYFRKNRATAFGESHVALSSPVGVAGGLNMNSRRARISPRSFEQAVTWFVALQSQDCDAAKRAEF